MPEGVNIRAVFAGGVLTFILLIVLWMFIVNGIDETFGWVSYALGWIISGHGVRILDFLRLNGSSVWSVWLAFMFYKIYKYLFMKQSNEILAIVVYLLVFLPIAFIIWNFFGWALMGLAQTEFGVSTSTTHGFQQMWDEHMYVFETAVVGVSIILITWEGLNLFWRYDINPRRG